MAAGPSVAHGQAGWDALLTVQPFPSPYFSDWDRNPNIGSLTILNHTASAEDVRVFFTITDRLNHVVAHGVSEPERVGPGGIMVYDSPYEIAGRGSHDAELERIASRTGRLPEGDYTACAAAADPAGFVLAESCADFSIVYPDPPLLLTPENAAGVVEDAPLFQWTPVQVPLEYQVSYVVRIVEVLPDQVPGDALLVNVPVHEERDAIGTSYRYPIGARPLEAGRTYAWAVRALDQNGYPASGNEGSSEIRTFRLIDPTAPAPAPGERLVRITNERDADGAAADDDGAAVTLRTVCSLIGTDSQSWQGPLDLALRIPVAVPDGVLHDGPGQLFTDGATRSWALIASGPRLSFLLYGECDNGPAVVGGLRWLAMRTTGRLGDLTDGLPLSPTSTTDLPLRFGTVIVALGPGSTTMPDGFEEARRFLNYREIDLRLGLNLYAMVDVLRDDTPDVRPPEPAEPGPADVSLATILEMLGYPDRYIEFQGFIGVDASWSVGAHVGASAMVPDAAQAELTRTRTLMSLRAALPRREPRVLRGFFESVQTGILFELTDSTGIHVGTTRGTQTNLEPALYATLDMVARESTFAPGSVWSGRLGYQWTRTSIDTAHARLRGLLPGPLAGYDSTAWSGKWLLRLGVNRLAVGAGRGLFSNVYLSGVQLQIDLHNVLAAIRSGNPGADLEIDATGTASIGVGEYSDLGLVMLGIGRRAEEVRAPAVASLETPRPVRPMGPMTRAEAEAEERRREQNRQAGVFEPVDPPDGQRPGDRRAGQFEPVDPPDEEQQRANRQAGQWEAVNPGDRPGDATDQAPRTDAPQPATAAAPGRWHWGARVALGNMSLGELFRLIRQGVGEAPRQDDDDG